MSWLLLAGCTTIRWHDPRNPDGPPIFEYRSGKDIAADGFLVEISYYEDGSVQMIHVEIGHASGAASPVWDSAGDFTEKLTTGIAQGVVEGLKASGGVP